MLCNSTVNGKDDYCIPFDLIQWNAEVRAFGNIERALSGVPLYTLLKAHSEEIDTINNTVSLPTTPALTYVVGAGVVV